MVGPHPRADLRTGTDLFEGGIAGSAGGGGAVGPVCVLRAEALTHNLAAMAGWCRDRDVELAPHGKTHMAPQLFARQLDAGACGITAATLSHVRTYRFGVRDIVLTNELVDGAGLRWLAAELDAHPDFSMVCWVDLVNGVELMTAALSAAGAERAVDVCVEVGMPGGRRDVSFDQDVPVPLGLADSAVTKLNDQHAYLRLGAGASVEVGSWLGFGISHPCTVFDKWQLIPELDADDRVVGLIRTFF